MTNKKTTVEYYGDPLLVKLIGAVDVPDERRMEAALYIGKAICRINELRSMEAVLIDENGEKINQIVVYQ